MLNKQDPLKKCTVEFENDNYLLSFKDINIISNTTNKKYGLKTHRKDAITNMHFKPNSSMTPSITKSIFKGFLHWAYTICSEKYIKEETQFLIGMFVKSGCKTTFLENLVKNYNAKKTTTVAVTLTHAKSRGYLILDQKLGNNLKR